MQHKPRNKFKHMLSPANRVPGNDPPVRALRTEAVDGGTAIYIYDIIVEDKWESEFWGGVCPDDLIEALGQAQGTVHLHINSPGGSVFAARTMNSALVQHKEKVIAHVDGIAASAATMIAMGADEIEMMSGAFFMIHNAWMCVCGNKEDLQYCVEFLAKVDKAAAQDYQRKSGASDEQVAAWMDAETWFTAQEALDAGLIDRIFEAEPVQNKFDLSAFDKTPAALLTPKEPDQPEDDKPPMDFATMLRRIQLFEDVGN